MGGVRALIPCVALAAALALASPASSSAASPTIPLFEFHENAHLLGDSADISFDAFNLDSALSPERFAFSFPQAFGVAFGQAPGMNLGTAAVVTRISAGGPTTEFDGQVVVMDPVAFATSPVAQACASGSHTAVWQLAVRSQGGQSLSIPVAIDSNATGYEFAMCFDDERAQGMQVSEVYIELNDFVRNPITPGQYLFDGVVTPFGTDGKPNAPSTYEIRAYSVLPQTLTATATYNRVTKIFTVSGVSKLNGKPRDDVSVNIYAGASQDTSTMKSLGTATTRANGSYTLSKKVATAPKFMVGTIDHYYHSICPNPTQPGGCVSDTTDGRDTFVTPVHVVAPKKKKK